MIAMPIKTDSENGVLAPLFGHAKYFCICADNGVVTTHKNNASGGVDVVRFLSELGVTKIILNHVGEKPFHLLTQNNIEVYFGGKERIAFNDALIKLQNGVLDKVTIQNYMSLLGDDDHTHDDGHHHHSGGCGCSQ